MKNGDRYKTPDERTKAFNKWCDNGVGKGAFKKCLANRCIDCFIRWLDLEAEDEELLKCPYCGGKTVMNLGHLFQNKLHHWVECTNFDCMYRSGHFLYRSDAIQKHNRVARAVMESNKEGATE